LSPPRGLPRVPARDHRTRKLTHYPQPSAIPPPPLRCYAWEVVTRARDGLPAVREIEHTADVGFEVEAPALAELFERAGLAMLGLMVDLTGVEPRERVGIAVEAEGLEELLHDFLSDLLVRVETMGFVACELAVEVVDARAVRGEAAGERIDRAHHRLYGLVKAVTYHQLAVEQRDGGWSARVILDV